MKGLADLITYRMEDMGAPLINKIEKKDMSKWEDCIRKVGELPHMYVESIKKAASQGRCRKDKIRGGWVLTVPGKVNGYEVELVVTESDNHEIKSAKYMAYNEKENLCFSRDLLSLGG